MPEDPAPVVHDDPDSSRFTAHLDGEMVGFLDYRLDGDRVVMTHTEVDPAFEGRGIGSSLTRQALDIVRERGQSVVPRCAFVVWWIRENEDYQDLLAS